MARCSYCRRSNILLRTDSHGLCKGCREGIRAKAEAEREVVKREWISAQFLDEPSKRVHHLRRALDGTNNLLRYEKLGCHLPDPSPKALKVSLEERLREATVT